MRLCGLMLLLATLSTSARAADPASELEALNDRVAELFNSQRYEEAAEAATARLAHQRARLGDEHPDVADSISTLADILRVTGDLESARPLYVESLAIRRSTLGDEHPDVARALNDLALLAHMQGRYEDARPLYEESIAIRRIALGENHPKVAQSLNNLAGLARMQGDYRAAVDLLEQSLAIKRAHPDTKPVAIATSLGNLGVMLKTLGEYDDALPLYKENLAILRETLGEGHPDVAGSLVNLATLLKTQGDYAAARPLYERGLEIWREVHGEDHPNVAHGLNNLAVLLRRQGDYAAAKPMYERSLEIRRATVGDDHPDVATNLNNLALLLRLQEDWDGALALYEESLAISRAAFGDEHADVASTMSNMAVLFGAKGDYAGAIHFFTTSLAIQRQVLGEGHIDVARTLIGLSSVFQEQGDLAAAEPPAAESLAIYRAALGDGHPAVAASLDSLARVLQAQGKKEAAQPLRTEALAIVEQRLSLLDALSEREALAHVPRVREILDGWLQSFDAPEHNAAAWSHALQFKGAIASRLSAARVSAMHDPEASAIAAELRGVRREIARLALSNDSEGRRTRLVDLSDARDRLERELLQLSASHRADRAASNAGPAELCAALPDGGALVDFLRYTVNGTDVYVAFTAKAGDCAPRRTELGSAESLDDAIAAWRKVMDDASAVATRVDVRGARVTELLWTPLEAVVGDETHLFVVPDGAIASAPLSALPLTNGRYLLEDRSITWLDRAADLLLPPSEGARGALVVGGVDYDATSGGEPGKRGALAPCNEGRFEALPGAAAEAAAISERWKRSRRKEPLTHLGGVEATEAAVTKALSGKEVVHLATHGFFATGRCKSALEGDGGIGFDPMVLSGLVLSGANQPADPLAADDGILTAAEVAALDLSGTALVVLSACETGLGEVRSGEGVLGLRRAFSVAGAGTLLMSLWSVPDEDTRSLMDQVYRLYLHKHRPVGAAEALRTAQLQTLDRQRNDGAVRPGSWAGFISAGDWR